MPAGRVLNEIRWHSAEWCKNNFQGKSQRYRGGKTSWEVGKNDLGISDFDFHA